MVLLNVQSPEELVRSAVTLSSVMSIVRVRQRQSINRLKVAERLDDTLSNAGLATELAERVLRRIDRMAILGSDVGKILSVKEHHDRELC